MVIKQISKFFRICAFGLLGFLPLSINSNAQEADGVGTSGALSLAIAEVNTPQTSSQIQVYWTPERMVNAKPIDISVPSTGAETTGGRISGSSTDPDAVPVLVPGWNPNSGLPQPAPDTMIFLDKESANGWSNMPSYGFNQAPSNPIDYANYGKYQRYTMMRNYLVYPSSVLGKLFFSDSSGGNFVCSATVVNRNTIITAGHCVADGGASTFYNNFLFCPSYYRASGSGGPHPSRGCWSYATAATSTAWYADGSLDRDYACLVMSTTGTLVADNIGDVTGWAGMAYNFGADELVSATGYPAASPFRGYHIITTFAPEWYTSNRATADTAVSKYIGNDMTGGSSGGGWLLDWEHRVFRYDAVDTTNTTDPHQNAGGGPYVHGINSHKRCMTACTTPPTATQGVFTNEMGSPMFEMNSGDEGDVESVYQWCVTNGGS